MSNEVKVVADQNGNIINVSENNPEYGWIFLQQSGFQMENGWLRAVVKKARIMGKVEELKDLNYTKDTVLPGKIVIVESLTPTNSEDATRDMKMAGTTGVVCRVNDQPIYRRVLYTMDTTAVDVLIPHTNTDEIKKVQAVQKAKSLSRIAQYADL